MRHAVADWLGGGTVTVPCRIEIESSFDSLHAHAVPEGITLRPGDRVVVHGAPGAVRFGDVRSYGTTATVHRAGPVLRLWTEAVAMLELFELFHCGFEPKEYAP